MVRLFQRTLVVCEGADMPGAARLWPEMILRLLHGQHPGNRIGNTPSATRQARVVNTPSTLAVPMRR